MLQPKPVETSPQVTPELLKKLAGEYVTHVCVAPIEAPAEADERRERVIRGFERIMDLGGPDVVKDHTKYLPGSDMESTDVLDIDLGDCGSDDTYKARIRRSRALIKATFFRESDSRREYLIGTSIQIHNSARVSLGVIERAEEAQALLLAVLQANKRSIA